MPITVVLDNARYQRCHLVQDTAKHLNIELLFLPTYFTAIQSNRTILEVGEEKLLEYPLLPHLSRLQKSILHFIKTAHIEKKDSLKSLLTFNFQSF